MINRFFNEYRSQKDIFRHETEIRETTSKSIKVLCKNEDVLRSRILRTFLRRNPKTQQISFYNFDPKEFKQYLQIYDAILPSIITQNDTGHFVLVFESENQTDAFLEGINQWNYLLLISLTHKILYK